MKMYIVSAYVVWKKAYHDFVLRRILSHVNSFGNEGKKRGRIRQMEPHCISQG